MVDPTMSAPPEPGPDRSADPALAARAAARDPRTRSRRTLRAPAQTVAPAAGRRTAQSALRDPAPWAVAITVVTLGLWALTGGLGSLVSGGIDTALAISRLSGLVAALSRWPPALASCSRAPTGSCGWTRLRAGACC